MAEKGLVLEAKKRIVIGKGVKRLRRAGSLPAVVYGGGMEPTAIELDSKNTATLLSGVSRSTLLDLDVEGDNHKVLLRDVQVDVIRRNLIHIDFLKVSLDIKITATVPIELTGEAPVLNEAGAILVVGVKEVEVESLPQDLPERFLVDLSILETFDDTLTVADLKQDDNVDILSDDEELLARVIYQEEEVIEVEEEIEDFVAEGEEPELVGRGEEEDADAESDQKPEESEEE